MTNEDIFFVQYDDEGNVALKKRFRAVATVEVPFESDVVEAALETGEPVADHVVHKRPVIAMELLLFTDPNPGADDFSNRFEAYEWLFSFWWNKEIFTLVCDMGEFQNMVIQSFKSTESSGSGNTFEVSLAVKQIVFVDYLPATFQYVTDKDGTVIDGAPITSETEQVALYEPTKKKKQEGGWDWPILTWIGDNTGWW